MGKRAVVPAGQRSLAGGRGARGITCASKRRQEAAIVQAMHKATEEEAQATVGAYSNAPSETGFWIADRRE